MLVPVEPVGLRADGGQRRRSAGDAELAVDVLEYSTGPVFFALPGRLVKIAPDGTRTTVVAGLTRPGSVAAGPDGALYVSNRAISVSTGELLRIES